MQTLSSILSTKEFLNQKIFLPEQELLVAILDRAVLDFCGREGDLHIKAKSWLFDDNSLDDTFSFCSICAYLNLDPSAIRERILNLDIPKGVSQSHRWLRTKVQNTSKKRKKRARVLS